MAESFVMHSDLKQNTAPAIAISVNGKHLVTVSTGGRNVVSVNVHGDMIGPELASMHVSGGRYGEGEENEHLIWVDQLEIQPEDEVSVAFLANATDSHAGKTIEELYPEHESPMGPWQSHEQLFEELSKEARFRLGFAFQLSNGFGEEISAQTVTEDHSFGFSILWNWMHPERARVSLSSNSLAGISSRTGGTDHASFYLKYGENTKLRVNSTSLR